MSSSAAFTIYDFSDGNLYQALSCTHCAVSEVANNARANYLVNYLKDVGARKIVVENDYVDRDYLDDFASYYVRCFQSYSRRCKRLHFFSFDFGNDNFRQLLLKEADEETTQKIIGSYLGFIVARPLPDAIIGRTVLAVYENDSGRRNYTCLTKYDANLFGIDLSVFSLAFQEQDTVLAACATVALWSCFNKTRDLFGSSSPTPAEITRTANQVVHLARPIPSHGLIVQQICNAIRQVGLEPEVIVVRPNVPLPSLLYAHLKMGLPVILGVHIEGQAGHAITLTGYSLQKEKVLLQEIAGNEKCIPMIGLRIDELYAHDDQIGPFSRIKINPSATIGNVVSPVILDGSWRDPQTGNFLKLVPSVVIIPVYNKIRVTFIDIQKWLTRLHTIMELLFPPKQDLEWDVYLTTTNDYKREMKNRPAASKELLEKVLLNHHPKYIWKAVLTINRVTLVEILSDATDMERSLPVYEVIWHNEGIQPALKQFLAEPKLQDLLISILTRPFLNLLAKSLA